MNREITEIVAVPGAYIIVHFRLPKGAIIVSITEVECLRTYYNESHADLRKALGNWGLCL